MVTVAKRRPGRGHEEGSLVRRQEDEEVNMVSRQGRNRGNHGKEKTVAMRSDSGVEAMQILW